MHCQQRNKKSPINALFTMHTVFSVPGTTPPGVTAAFHIEVEAVQRHAIWNVIPVYSNTETQNICWRRRDYQ